MTARRKVDRGGKKEKRKKLFRILKHSSGFGVMDCEKFAVRQLCSKVPLCCAHLGP